MKEILTEVFTTNCNGAKQIFSGQFPTHLSMLVLVVKRGHWLSVKGYVTWKGFGECGSDGFAHWHYIISILSLAGIDNPTTVIFSFHSWVTTRFWGQFKNLQHKRHMWSKKESLHTLQKNIRNYITLNSRILQCMDDKGMELD